MSFNFTPSCIPPVDPRVRLLRRTDVRRAEVLFNKSANLLDASAGSGAAANAGAGASSKAVAAAFAARPSWKHRLRAIHCQFRAAELLHRKGNWELVSPVRFHSFAPRRFPSLVVVTAVCACPSLL